MTLTPSQLQQLASSSLTRDERARLMCRLVKELENAGRYEDATDIMGDIWRGVGARPRLDGLDRRTGAEVLLRAGTLSGWVGSARQVEGAQEAAKDLISESASVFEELEEAGKVAEARIDLAICYRREGAFDEARVALQDALSRLGDEDTHLRARALLTRAIVDRYATRYEDSLRTLLEASPLFEEAGNQTLKGSFHNELATVYENLGRLENSEDYLDRALIEYTAASFHYEQTEYKGFCAIVENNLGFLFNARGRFTEAHEHLDHARRLFSELEDKGSVAQVDETRARTFLSEGRVAEAERTARASVEALEHAGEQSVLAEALTTRGTALARLGRYADARAALGRAVETAEVSGSLELAGLAALTAVEELCEYLDAEALRDLYNRADELLASSQILGYPERLRKCARKIIGGARPPSRAGETADFVYAEPATAEFLRGAALVARAGGAVVLSGETGTGKDIVARLLHTWSGRAGEFVKVGCAGLSDQVFETKLFGAAGGDPAGAVFEADGGTLFLDEIGELGLAGQAKLLRLIEYGEAQAADDSAPRPVDVRIVASTNDDLARLVEEGLFRKDLYYRLQNFVLEIPPLRERPADTAALARHFIDHSPARQAKRVTFASGAAEAFASMPLKGNARELHSLVERAVMMADDGAVITPELVELLALRGAARDGFEGLWKDFSLKDEVHRIERRFIELALKDSNGMVSRAARLLGFKHHESLASLLKTRHSGLIHARTPAKARRRSIIPKEKR